MQDVVVIASQYSKDGECGDFGWMIERPEYADTLFIFNDNENQFRDYVNDPTSGTSGCQDGKGNAAIRHYRCEDPPRAAGVPTGPGYKDLTDDVRGVIDEAFAIIKKLLATGGYKRVIYSAANSRGDLGTQIFPVGDDVKSYIVAELRKLED